VFCILLLTPVLITVGLIIKISSPGRVFFRQERVGKNGQLFRIHKFRTMVEDAETSGPKITIGKDSRVTSIGHVLRKYKLDELPQLFDVIIGKMSLVGPRPEVPEYVNRYPNDIRDVVLSVKPGITDWASINFKDENQMLASALNPENVYIEKILPIKLKYYVDYVNNRTLIGDIKIILVTVFRLLI
jgi:lipopolysaccharide/colanic/teichoic acid biosynthesis glycosyltransferase